MSSNGRYSNGRYCLKNSRFYNVNFWGSTKTNRYFKRSDSLRIKRLKPACQKLPSSEEIYMRREDEINAITPSELRRILEDLHSSDFEAQLSCVELCRAFDSCSMEFRYQALRKGVLRKLAFQITCPVSKGLFRSALLALISFASGTDWNDQNTWPSSLEAEPVVQVLARIITSAKLSAKGVSLQDYYFETEVALIDEEILALIFQALGTFLLCGGNVIKCVTDSNIIEILMEYSVAKNMPASLSESALISLSGAVIGGEPKVLSYLGIKSQTKNETKETPLLDSLNDLLKSSKVAVRRKACSLLAAGIRHSESRFVQIMFNQTDLIRLLLEQLNCVSLNGSDDDRREATEVIFRIFKLNRKEYDKLLLNEEMLKSLFLLLNTQDKKMLDISFFLLEHVISISPSYIDQNTMKNIMAETNVQQHLNRLIHSNSQSSSKANSLLKSLSRMSNHISAKLD
eukprot:CAMPEP_0171463102 /NCGR_PEP_ID=MMETSP0945-20130129/6882_1 /TAXON_ID=109269 /ORGANISM="Vaucheria litorea, Strain CCMP2940" /LENGTH=457 /DNA_ID=CAMNT_0011989777 /DNA_START=43 /DNA_END=1416 /DNA_ORIENTATION=+